MLLCLKDPFLLEKKSLYKPHTSTTVEVCNAGVLTVVFRLYVFPLPNRAVLTFLSALRLSISISVMNLALSRINPIFFSSP